ncbi:Uu.00g114630.m01.CDS01 [Anthostomella pinea]|uniref:Uu.00g114630.m01.CDS01 n=1 Tax=Anthostomella pinea TaxID=933095 RepID=A0AAI8VFM8_9PEZI|nr:Uu.00g114630.m01.CDS01 [Anthostomella pinea]
MLKDFTTLVLAKLRADLDIAKRFDKRVDKRTKDIQLFERGFWQLDCTGWDNQLRFEAWAYITNYVASGMGDWGFWAVRDEEFPRIRVYCWGQTVPHAYLLLYLASQREILFTGASWYDGGGQEAIVMKTSLGD